MQTKLFIQAKKYAKELQNLEEKARLAAIQLQKYSIDSLNIKKKMLKVKQNRLKFFRIYMFFRLKNKLNY